MDDYRCVSACKQATENYRAQHNIMEPGQQIDWTGVFCRKNR
ncbi:MAG: hypothetical protein HY913_17080 [Desulfomonile tiedjei]|nr:hypothetical protein [Desulfomonile tiedjei]